MHMICLRQLSRLSEQFTHTLSENYNHLKLLRLSPSVQNNMSESTLSGSVNDSPYTVEHDTEKSKFFIKLAIPGSSADRAVLEYRLCNSHTMDLYHTEVPPSFRGKGVAQLLVQAALDYVVEQDKKMILTCWYVDKYVREKKPLPQYLSRVVHSADI